nr:hypothetical protein BaRGS_007194 [Batillaria attramentaria]
MKQNKKAIEETTPSQVHMSKAAKKNAKRKEKKKQEQANPSSVSDVTRGMQQAKIAEHKDTSSAVQDGSEAKPDLAKKLKNLKKKLKQIEDLESRITSGELKNPDKDQLEKVSRKQLIIDEIEDLELEMTDSS